MAEVGPLPPSKLNLNPPRFGAQDADAACFVGDTRPQTQGGATAGLGRERSHGRTSESGRDKACPGGWARGRGVRPSVTSAQEMGVVGGGVAVGEQAGPQPG